MISKNFKDTKYFKFLWCNNLSLILKILDEFLMLSSSLVAILRKFNFNKPRILKNTREKV